MPTVTLLVLAGALLLASAPDEEAILAAAAEAREASRTFDFQKLASLLADDFVAIDPSGTLRDKIAFLAMMAAVSPELKAANRNLKVVQSDVRVRQYGDAAIVTERRDAGEPPALSSARYTQVWVKHEGRWRLASVQATRTAATASTQ